MQLLGKRKKKEMKKFTLLIRIQKIYFFILFYPGFSISKKMQKKKYFRKFCLFLKQNEVAVKIG